MLLVNLIYLRCSSFLYENRDKLPRAFKEFRNPFLDLKDLYKLLDHHFIEHDKELINNINIELEKLEHVKFVAVPYHMELLPLYVHLVPVLENLQRLQEVLLKIIYVVVSIQIERIAHGARNHAIMIHP